MKKQKLLTILLAAVLGGTMPAAAKTEIPDEIRPYDITIHTYEDNPVILKGFSVEGVNMEGKTREEVSEWIVDYVDARLKKHLKLTVLGENEFHYDGNTLGVSWSNPEVLNQLGLYLNDGNLVEQYKRQKDLENNPVNLDITFAYDEKYLEDQIALLTRQFESDPVNASVDRVDNEFVITPEVYGVSFDTESIINEVTNVMFNMDSADSIEYEFPYTSIMPRVTSVVFENYAPQPLGSYTTGNLGGENRSNNILLSISRINGKLVMPGEEVSALGLYGPQTLENGYLEAPGYEDGQQVPSIGGGVCQTTTTLYNACLLAELTILKRYGHSMMVTYAPPALDAAVSAGGKDLVFRNDYNNPVYIEAFAGKSELNGKKNITVNIWGVDENPSRRVEYDYNIISCTWPDPLYVIQPDNSLTTYGPNADVWEKISAEVEVHPAVAAKSVKKIYIDGVLTAQEDLNYNEYREMRGLLVHATDCFIADNRVETPKNDYQRRNATYPYLNANIYHDVRFLNGEDWSPVTAEDNYIP